jgi:hypothetical protein
MTGSSLGTQTHNARRGMPERGALRPQVVPRVVGCRQLACFDGQGQCTQGRRGFARPCPVSVPYDESVDRATSSRRAEHRSKWLYDRRCEGGVE